MPTADDFELLAVTLDVQADELDDVMTPLRPMIELDVMAGGGLRDDLAARLDDDAGWMAIEAGVLRDAAATCRDRAVVCRVAEAASIAHGEAWRVYERDLAAWRRDDTAGGCGPRPRPPIAPAEPPGWVEW